ncbi:MAG: ribonuclease III [Nitrospinae bacterium]|nr:ribonuclease III [Nitrospinota bacterium]
MISFFRRKRLAKPDAEREKILGEFEKIIGYKFKNLNILNAALTHPSYLHENQITDEYHYERMEFLGDSVLGLIVCKHLYCQFPEYAEGELSDIKSHVVSEKHLANISKRMELGKYIRFGAGEARTGGRKKSSILANAFESVLGAIFLDGGYQKADAYLLKFSRDDIVIHPPDRESSNYKGRLQKYCQTYLHSDPNYRVVGEVGPSHSRKFEMEVWSANVKLGSGKGKSKKEAEQSAASQSIRYFESEEFRTSHPEAFENGSKKRSRRNKWGANKPQSN